MVCDGINYCKNPKLNNTEGNIFCFNCYGSYKKDENVSTPIQVDKYQCCNEPNILYEENQDICINCGTIHEKFIDIPTYLENDSFLTNVLKKRKMIFIYHINI